MGGTAGRMVGLPKPSSSDRGAKFFSCPEKTEELLAGVQNMCQRVSTAARHFYTIIAIFTRFYAILRDFCAILHDFYTILRDFLPGTNFLLPGT